MPPRRPPSFPGSLPEDPEERVDLLSPREQELLARVLGHAESLSSARAELLELVESAIARAVGDLLLGQAAEVIGIEVIEVLKARGPHPPKGRSRPQGPHPAKGRRKGKARPSTGPHPPKAKRRRKGIPQTGPHPPKPVGPGKAIPTTGPHPPKPPGPGKARPAKRRLPKGPPRGGRVKPLTGPHPPKPPGPGTARAMSGVSVSHAETAKHPQLVHAVHATAEEFLAPSELQELMRHTLFRERNFEISEVVSPGVAGRGTVDHEYRRSRVLMDLAEHEARFLDRIRGMLPLVFRNLKMDPFTPERAELQITASNDGDFFRDHSDNSHPEIASRAITFVYFFNTEPAPFRGGELRLYDTQRQGDDSVRHGEGRVIVPEQNQMVFFPSGLVHEITPVICPSQNFTDSRFTVNGWLHRS